MKLHLATWPRKYVSSSSKISRSSTVTSSKTRDEAWVTQSRIRVRTSPGQVHYCVGAFWWCTCNVEDWNKSVSLVSGQLGLEFWVYKLEPQPGWSADQKFASPRVDFEWQNECFASIFVTWSVRRNYSQNCYLSNERNVRAVAWLERELWCS